MDLKNISPNKKRRLMKHLSRILDRKTIGCSIEKKNTQV